MVDNTNYGNCDYCGAKKVKNPKTGKVFCSAKCWLKNAPDAQNAPQNQSLPQKSTSATPQKKVDVEYRNDLLLVIQDIHTIVKSNHNMLNQIIDILNNELGQKE